MAIVPKQRAVVVSVAQRRELEALLRRTNVAAGRARRARALLLLAGGSSASWINRSRIAFSANGPNDDAGVSPR